VQGNALYDCVDPEPVPQTFRAAVRRVGDLGLDHYAFDDLPDSDTGKRPNWHMRQLARFLRLPDTVGGVQSIEKLWRHGNRAVHGFLLTRAIFALLERPDGHGPAGKVDTSGRDLDQL